MTVRKRKWSDKAGRQHEKWMIHIEHTWPDGRKQTIRKVSPMQTKRGAEQYERELRQQLVSGNCNAAANGVSTRGAWLICNGEPCMMCAKLIHHAGITRVLVVAGGYLGSNGCEYLKQHGVGVVPLDGPKDPRLEAQGELD